MRQHIMGLHWEIIMDGAIVCVFVRVCVSFVWKSPRSIFCGQTEGSGKVDHVQYLMAHYLFMSPTIHGPLGKNAVCMQCVH